jgi:hypothetical protein
LPMALPYATRSLQPLKQLRSAAHLSLRFTRGLYYAVLLSVWCGVTKRLFHLLVIECRLKARKPIDVRVELSECIRERLDCQIRACCKHGEIAPIHIGRLGLHEPESAHEN